MSLSGRVYWWAGCRRGAFPGYPAPGSGLLDTPHCCRASVHALQASLTCAVTGPITVPDMKKLEGSEGREVFSEKKGLNLFQVRMGAWEQWRMGAWAHGHAHGSSVL